MKTSRRKRVGGLLLALGLFACVRAETLTVATYNIENYCAANRMTDAGYRRDYPKQESEKAALRAVIRGLDADVLVLQEMGPQPYLDELRRDLKSEGVDYPQAALLDGPDAVRHLAVLSRRPLAAVVPHRGRELEFAYFGARETVKRGLLEVRLATAGGAVTLWVVHLKSRYTDRRDDPESAIRRKAEATAIRNLVLERFPDPATAHFLILGDFNDDKSSGAVRRLLHRGKTTITTLLPAADSQGEVWTYFYRKRDSYARLDQMLVSPGLSAAVVGGAARIYDGAGVGGASDHRPVIVTLQMDDRRSEFGAEK
jgi:endonuclease/exonuclease/phosphatase family metal-dependent hydrolase